LDCEAFSENIFVKLNNGLTTHKVEKIKQKEINIKEGVILTGYISGLNHSDLFNIIEIINIIFALPIDLKKLLIKN